LPRGFQLDAGLIFQQNSCVDNSYKVREDRVRRMLARQGYHLTKSRRRDPRARDYGTYQITHILAGGTDTGVVAEYFGSLDDAERWAIDGDRGVEPGEYAPSRPEADWQEIGTFTVSARWLAELASTGGGPYQVKVFRDGAGRARLIKGNL
jgi:hypothetical protein